MHLARVFGSHERGSTDQREITFYNWMIFPLRTSVINFILNIVGTPLAFVPGVGIFAALALCFFQYMNFANGGPLAKYILPQEQGN